MPILSVFERDILTRPRALYILRLRTSKLRSAFPQRIADRVAAVHPGGWLLDVGCGPGLLENRLASRFGRDRLVGVDIDRDMLVVAGSEGVMDLIRGSSACLPFRDGSIATAVLSASLKDWGDRIGGLREMERVLRPGGTAVVYDFITAIPGSRPEGFARRFGIVSEILRRLMASRMPFPLDDGNRLLGELDGIDAALEVEEDLGALRITIEKRA